MSMEGEGISERLTKFHAMEPMQDRDFVLYGVSLVAKSLQALIDAWLPIVGGTSNYHLIEDPYWDFTANIRLCVAMKLIDDKTADDLALLTQIAGLYLSKPRTRLSGAHVGDLVNKLDVLATLDATAASGDPDKIHIAVLRLNLGSTRDRYRMAIRALDAHFLDLSDNAKETAFARFNRASARNDEALDGDDRAYRAALGAYEEALQNAIDFSRFAGNRPSETSRIYWASILFTRLCNFGVSIAKLAPGSSYSHEKVDRIWDNSASSVLARSAFECFLLFFYLGIDDVENEVFAARQNLMYLHDATMRLRLFHPSEEEGPEHAFYMEQRRILIEKLEGNVYVQSLPEKRRKHLLKGRDLFFLTQDELIDRIGVERVAIRRFYELLSAHVHSLPLSFYRAMEDERGRGVENPAEKAYLTQSLQFLAPLLEAATESYRELSPPFLYGERAGAEGANGSEAQDQGAAGPKPTS